MRVYVGIDWGKKSSTYAYGRQGDKLKSVVLTNRVVGLTEISEKLLSLADGEPVVAVIESGAPAVTNWLIVAGITVHVVDGKRARRFVESLSSSGSKSDKLDAEFAWQMAQSPMHLDEPVSVLDGGLRALTIAVRARDQVGKSITRASNQLRAVLTELVPDLEGQLANLSRQYVWDLIRLVPSPWHAARLTDDEWATYLAEHRVPTKKKATLREAIEGDARRRGFDEPAAHAIAQTVRLMVDQLEQLCETDKGLEKTLKGIVNASPNASLIQTMGGVGLKLTSRLASTVFSPVHLERAEKSHDQRDYAARVARCVPVQNQTGTTNNQTKRRRSGNAAAAAAITHAAALASLNLPWATAMLAYRLSKGDGYYTALRKIGRSLLRILSAMIKAQRPYDNAHYVAQLKRKGVTWACDL